MEGDEATICYARKPRLGHVDDGLTKLGPACEFDKSYRLEREGDRGKTDVENLISYRVLSR